MEHAWRFGAVAVVLMGMGCADEKAKGFAGVLHPQDASYEVSDGGFIQDTGVGSDATTPIDAGTDAGHDAGPVVPVGCESPAAVVNADGVLSAYPDIYYSVYPFGFELLSANFRVTEDGDPRGPLIELWAEIRNNTSNTECTFLPDVSLAYMPLIGLVEAPAHVSMLSRVTSDCLSPGEVGVLNAVERGIDQADLDAALTLSIDMMPNTFTTYTRAVGPALVGSVDQTAEGWLVRGQITVPSTLYNYGLRLYPRDNRGLIIDELLAFPGDLDTLVSGTTVSYETSATRCPFDDYVYFQSWIDGPAN